SFSITIDLGEGTAEESVYTCDLSIDYIKINADYRS
ncbi:MAG: bifunctional ornithine acetyltransferase/N-acetylglutamate synthase, partial [Deltaproteobacteria bacterium]|nr:bifunctional ornithine acetyltransferase/N-acetylglutamate synthase [Deltaproteobacteria bacterium]